MVQWKSANILGGARGSLIGWDIHYLFISAINWRNNWEASPVAMTCVENHYVTASATPGWSSCNYEK